MNKQSKITAVETGVHTLIPLSQLLKSPRNVRKVPHTADAIEALAGSIAAKGILQNLVVEPETDEIDCPTGRFFVTIGEGRRLAQLLRLTRGAITDDEPIPCVIDTVNDPHEISLDENVTREAMHPADEFEAFRKMNIEDGRSAEDIAARFGVTVRKVKQRLRLGAVAPRLMQAYRDEKLTLDQLMAFCVSEDHTRQEAIYAGLNQWQQEPHHIRRLMTQGDVDSDDRRAKFIGIEAYEASGGQVERDLFTEEGGGRLTDGVLLDKLVLDLLMEEGAAVQTAEGWKWVEAHIDFPYIAGMRRAFPKVVALSDEDAMTLDAAKTELRNLSEAYEDYDEFPDDIDAKMTELETDIAELQARASAFDPDDIARAGVIVSLTYDGSVKVERGLIRAEDWEASQRQDDDADDDETADEGGDGGDYRDDQDGEDDEKKVVSTKLSDGLVRDLTAHRTVAMRLALGEQPEIAGRALAHLLVLDAFYGDRSSSCLEIRSVSTDLKGWMEDYDQSTAVEALQARHDAWAMRLPEADALWSYLLAMDPEDLGLLIAHCIGLTINVVRQPFDKRPAERFAEALATSLSLEMGAHWRPTARRYFSRVTKDQITEAVREAVGDAAADRIAKFKKADMAAEAETLVMPTGWFPPLLRVVPLALVAEAETELPEAAE
ncbi:MAG: ParB/RepB/Spo0J family partition protein [Asticcacaulis sp.]|uniref:ParB/RepB/Spo0J family partition protein n=1 Tax=Asticcacaulis sp. TaxID=1872648 RepID=UPI0039E33BFA